ncbi:C1 family peptidase [candidate division CSSED10-310 bacterium]|uniref:C1 family peptidase n=1 Tax=candidate division CSSED10-310 bacterium TaxID=2855610 RepID=A0ABV6Z2G3_UNCC1
MSRKIRQYFIPLVVVSLVLSTIVFFACLNDSDFSSNSAFTDENELANIQEALEKIGTPWIAAENPISQLPPEERRLLLGAADELPFIDSDKVMDYPVVLEGMSSQAYFTWQNHDGKNWMTAVKNQGNCGSCGAFATLGSLEALIKIAYNAPSMTVNLSEQHLFSCGGGSCSEGWYLQEAFNYCKNSGVPDEACLPYTQRDNNCGNTCSDWQARAVKIADWHWVTSGQANINKIKNALKQGPVPTRMEIYTDFYSYKSGVYEHTYGGYEGGHFVVIVGWDDSKNCWICKNSWGTTWGESGYFRIKRGQVTIGMLVGAMNYSARAPEPVYRFWSDAGQCHFYTISKAEKDHLSNNYPDDIWRYERIAWYCFSSPQPNTLPVYRFWSDTGQCHFYTISKAEKDHLSNNYPDDVWRYERIAWYAYPQQQSGTLPVYRFWSDVGQCHFYTISQAEKDYIIANYADNIWRYERIAWYAKAP